MVASWYSSATLLGDGMESVLTGGKGCWRAPKLRTTNARQTLTYAVPLRETTFISRNIDTWRELEAELARATPNPDRLNALYAAVVDDLSYARTHYPNRSVRAYLNAKASTLSLSLYRNRRGQTSFMRFWTRTVPLELYAQRRQLLLAAALFLLCFLIGWGSAEVDPAFAELVLSSDYVSMTEDNIAKEDPMAVYKQGSRLGGALGIAGNNLWVSMLCFVSGLFFGVGTLFVLLRNGIMVGTFQQFFFERGVGWESVLGIWTHGTIEISCIVVAAGAGFVLAKGILWPGTLSRSRSFQLTALSGLRIMAGIAPLIILAAIIEGFLTRLTDLPTALRILFLIANLAVVVYYFILLPRAVGAVEERESDDFGKLPPDRPIDWQPHRRMSASSIFFEAIRWFTKRSLPYILTFAAVGIPIGAIWVAAYSEGAGSAIYVDTSGYGPDVPALLLGTHPLAGGAVALLLIAALAWATPRLHRALPSAQAIKLTIGHYLGIALLWAAPVGAAALSLWLSFLTLPICLTAMRSLTYGELKLPRAIGEGFAYTFNRFAAMIGLAAMLTGICLTLGLAFDGLFSAFVFGFINLNLPPSWVSEYGVDQVAVIAANVLVLGIYATIWTVAFGLFYHSTREHVRAEGLKQRVADQFALT